MARRSFTSICSAPPTARVVIRWTTRTGFVMVRSGPAGPPGSSPGLEPRSITPPRRSPPRSPTGARRRPDRAHAAGRR
jgi:hypothetical protein